MDSFKAYRIHNQPGHRAGIESLSLSDLNPGEVTVRTNWSSVNYKDALAGTGKGRILRKYPLVGGIDIAGTVIESTDQRFAQRGPRAPASGLATAALRPGPLGTVVFGTLPDPGRAADDAGRSSPWRRPARI